MNNVIDLIISAFPDTATALFTVIFILITLWMFKQLRTSYIESSNSNIQRTDKAIDYYSDLEFEIYRYFNDKSDFMPIADKISKASSLMPIKILEKCNQCKKENDLEKRNDLLKELHKQLQNEIISLKNTQSDPVTFKSIDSIFLIENYIKTKISPFLIPLAQTFINLILLLVVISLTFTVISATSLTQKTLYISLIFVVVFYALLVHLIISQVIIKKRFDNSVLNWFLFSLFLILPPVFFFIGSWYRGIIIFILMIIYAIYVSKKSIKEPST